MRVNNKLAGESYINQIVIVKKQLYFFSTVYVKNSSEEVTNTKCNACGVRHEERNRKIENYKQKQKEEKGRNDNK
jgi:hypothetical protein